MIVTLRLFSVLREAFEAGVAEVELEVGTTGRDLVSILAARNNVVSRLESVIRLAVNDEYIEMNQVLKDGDDIALITPVSGG